MDSFALLAAMTITVNKVAQLTGHQGAIYKIAPGRGAGRFLTASGDGTIVEWDQSDTAHAKVIAHIKKTNIFALRFLSDTNELLLGQFQGGLHVLNLDNREETRHLAFHKGGIFDIHYRQADNRVYVAGGDGVLSVWQRADWQLLATLAVGSKSLRQIHFHPEKSQLAAGSSDNTISIIDWRKLQVVKVLRHHANSVFTVRFSPDGRHLLSGSRDAHLCIWEVEKDYQLKTAIPAHLFTINAIAFHPNQPVFATASRDKTVKLWDSHNFELLKVIDKEKLDGHINSVNALWWCPGQSRLITAGDDRAVMIWDIAVE